MPLRYSRAAARSKRATCEIATSQPVPFITAFATNRVDKDLQEKVRLALLDVGKDRKLKAAIETLNGFVAIDDDYRELRKAVRPESGTKSTRPAAKTEKAGPPQASGTQSPDEKATSSWPGWRGPARDGRVRFLPDRLPREPTFLWRKTLQRPGLGGIAATDKHVLIGDRDVSNSFDVFRCYSADDGSELWTVQYPAQGQLDYDNMPRATPLIYEGHAYLLGAFGDLSCVELETGARLANQSGPAIRWRQGAGVGPVFVAARC